jgi:DNA-binding beta-propeller fold protein YncE
MLAPAVLIANAGEGSVSVLDQKATVVQSTLDVGGTPVGVARTVDGRIWVADASSGSAVMFDAESGRRLQTITVAPHLTGLAATPDGHYLALASSDPRYCGRDGRGAGDR